MILRYFLPRLGSLTSVMLFLATTVSLLSMDSHVLAEDQQPQTVGRLIQVRLPIKDGAENRIIKIIKRTVRQLEQDKQEGVLVFEFTNRVKETAHESDFNDCNKLAETIANLRGVRTIAFLPEDVRGHAVLVTLACQEIYMSSKAKIGEAGIAEMRIDGNRRQQYEHFANLRNTFSPKVALGMLDPKFEVLRVLTDVSVEYLFAEELEDFRKNHALLGEPEKIINRGEYGIFSGAEARDYGFVKQKIENRVAIERLLELVPGSLNEDPSMGGQWDAVHLKIHGPIRSDLVKRVQLAIETEMKAGATLFILEIESPGGSVVNSLNLVYFLANLDSGIGGVKTVAYVPDQALADAALIALACDDLVMQPGATLGGSGAMNFTEGQLDDIKKSWSDEISIKKSRMWSLPFAMVNPDLEVFEYTRQGEKKLITAYLCEEEKNSLPNSKDWVKGGRLNTTGPISAEDAKQWRLAKAVVPDFEKLKDLYQLKEDPRTVEAGWAATLIDALADGSLHWVLLFIAMMAGYAELSSPGIGVGGFVSCVCFVLFFWSAKLNGTADWLEILLFVTGIVFLILEVFVIPGFGIFGIGGAGLILVSLILASQTFTIPNNPYQYQKFGNSMISITVVIVGFVALASVINKYLPRTPILGRVVLQAPQGDELELMIQKESLAGFNHLLGKQGRVITQLTPSGFANFEDEIVQVITEGVVISKNSKIVVVSVRGNNVYVKEQA